MVLVGSVGSLRVSPLASIGPVRRAYRRRRPEPEVSAYLGMAVRIIGEGVGRHLPAGAVGVVTRSALQDSGDRTYAVEFDAGNVTLSTSLPCPRQFELFTPDRPLTGDPLALSAGELVARYGSFRADVRNTTESDVVRYVIVTRQDEQR